MKQCPNCHQYVDDYATYCSNCGYDFSRRSGAYTPPHYNQAYGDNPFDPCGPEGKCRGVAALFAILLGGLGVQYFYLGKVSGGLITILLSLVTCGLWQVVMLVQGIMMFCMTNEQFRQKYVLSPSSLPLF